jgi:hypothetical protein
MFSWGPLYFCSSISPVNANHERVNPHRLPREVQVVPVDLENSSGLKDHFLVRILYWLAIEEPYNLYLGSKNDEQPQLPSFLLPTSKIL